jgi:hypothetical protein
MYTVMGKFLVFLDYSNILSDVQDAYKNRQSDRKKYLGSLWATSNRTRVQTRGYTSYNQTERVFNSYDVSWPLNSTQVTLLTTRVSRVAIYRPFNDIAHVSVFKGWM